MVFIGVQFCNELFDKLNFHSDMMYFELSITLTFRSSYFTSNFKMWVVFLFFFVFVFLMFQYSILCILCTKLTQDIISSEVQHFGFSKPEACIKNDGSLWKQCSVCMFSDLAYTCVLWAVERYDNARFSYQ